jgi:hypothetical protein
VQLGCIESETGWEGASRRSLYPSRYLIPFCVSVLWGSPSPLLDFNMGARGELTVHRQNEDGPPSGTVTSSISVKGLADGFVDTDDSTIVGVVDVHVVAREGAD